MTLPQPSLEQDVTIGPEAERISATLVVPARPRGAVIFAHGSGSGRFSQRNRSVAATLNAASYSTLLLDLLTPAEEAVDERTREFRFDIALLARRLAGATDWLAERFTQPIGYFGASTGAAAALIAAAARPDAIAAVVSRGGRPDLAGSALAAVRAPTLLIVGSLDASVIALNESAAARLTCVKRIQIVQGASHLFEEPGKLAEVSRLATDWFDLHLHA